MRRLFCLRWEQLVAALDAGSCVYLLESSLLVHPDLTPDTNDNHDSHNGHGGQEDDGSGGAERTPDVIVLGSLHECARQTLCAELRCLSVVQLQVRAGRMLNWPPFKALPPSAALTTQP